MSKISQPILSKYKANHSWNDNDKDDRTGRPFIHRRSPATRATAPYQSEPNLVVYGWPAAQLPNLHSVNDLRNSNNCATCAVAALQGQTVTQMLNAEETMQHAEGTSWAEICELLETPIENLAFFASIPEATQYLIDHLKPLTAVPFGIHSLVGSGKQSGHMLVAVKDKSNLLYLLDYQSGQMYSWSTLLQNYPFSWTEILIKHGKRSQITDFNAQTWPSKARDTSQEHVPMEM